MAVDVNSVSAALKALYDPQTPQDTRRQADEWLQAIGPRAEVWMVCDAWLACNPADGPLVEQQVLFAALTLQKKVARDFRQLPAESHLSLRQTVLRHIQRFNAAVAVKLRANPGALPGGAEFTALRHLCIAYADLLVHMVAVPGQALQELCGVFTLPDGAMALLEILTAMPEEARRLRERAADLREGASSESDGGGGQQPGTPSSASHPGTPVATPAPPYSAADLDNFDMFRSNLDACGPDVLGLLLSILRGGMSSGSVAVVDRVFTAFGTWIGQCRIDASVVAASPLLNSCFEAVTNYPKLFGSASSAIQEVLERYRNPRTGKPVFDLVIPFVLDAAPKLFEAAAARGEEGEEACLVLSRLFSDAGYQYVYYMLRCPDIASGEVPDPAWEAQRFRFFLVINRCAAHPSTAVSEATFRFWSMVAECFHALDSTYDEATQRWKKELCRQLGPAMLEVAKTFLNRLRFPDPETWHDTPRDLQDDFRHGYRYDCADVLQCCTEVAGYEPMLSMLAAKLREELDLYASSGKAAAASAGGTGWEGVEACLYSIRSIAHFVPQSELTYLPGVFTLLPQLPPHPELRATCFRVVGRYARWLGDHEASVPGVLDFVVAGGLCAHQSVPGAPPGAPALASPQVECAARALSQIAHASPAASWPTVLQIPSRLPLLSLHPTVYTEVINAVAPAVASTCKDYEGAFSTLAQPLLQRLHLFTSDPSAALMASAGDGLLASTLTAPDGIVKRVNFSELGLEESTAERLWAAAQASHGNLSAHASAFNPQRAATVCVKHLVTKLVGMTAELRPDTSTMAITSGILPKESARSSIPRDAWAEIRQKEDELAAAAQRGVRAGAWAVQQAAYPVMEAVWRTYGLSEPGLLSDLGYFWSLGASKCGAAFAPLVSRVVNLIGVRLTSAPVPHAIDALSLIVREAGALSSPPTNQPPAELGEAIGAVFGIVAVMVQKEGATASAAAAGTPVAKPGGAASSSPHSSSDFLEALYRLLGHAVSEMPDTVATAAYTPGSIQLILATIQRVHVPACESMLFYLASLLQNVYKGSAPPSARSGGGASMAAAAWSVLRGGIRSLVGQVVKALLTLSLARSHYDLLRDKHPLQDALYSLHLVAPQESAAAFKSLLSESAAPGAPSLIPADLGSVVPEPYCSGLLSSLFPHGGAGQEVWNRGIRCLHEAVNTRDWDRLRDVMYHGNAAGGGGRDADGVQRFWGDDDEDDDRTTVRSDAVPGRGDQDGLHGESDRPYYEEGRGQHRS